MTNLVDKTKDIHERNFTKETQDTKRKQTRLNKHAIKKSKKPTTKQTQ